MASVWQMEEARMTCAIENLQEENRRLREWARKCLRYRMEELSEDHFAAGWVLRLEFILWEFVEGRRTFPYEPENAAAELRQMAEDAGGWWIWDEMDGRFFVTLEEWREIRESEGG